MNKFKYLLDTIILIKRVLLFSSVLIIGIIIYAILLNFTFIEQNLWLGLGGIILLAAAVNIVELACSAGLPVLYTGILSAAGLATWQYYAYMLLYILFFMIDDLIIFFIAMTTLKVVGIESKYFRITRLIGGVAMCILGLLLILAPQILMFG